MMLEVPLKDDSSQYWLAKVVLACGPFSRYFKAEVHFSCTPIVVLSIIPACLSVFALFRLRYSGDVSDQSADFWCDLTKCNAQPLGWCAKEGRELTPPESVANLIEDTQSHVEEVLKNAKPVPAQLLSGVSVMCEQG